jgi:hypothetical protein
VCDPTDCIAAAGASYEVTDPDKGNPAQIAAYWGHLEAVVKLVEAGCSWPHGKTARGVAGGDVVKWICNITTNKVGWACVIWGCCYGWWLLGTGRMVQCWGNSIARFPG